MPLRDGTGPLGSGPLSGRGFGCCRKITRNLFQKGISGRVGTKSTRVPVSYLIVPLGAAVLTDILRADSVLRRLPGKITRFLRNRTAIKQIP